ncbi:MAG: alkaline phosphatase family protein [Rhodothermales bacterium]
MKLPTVLSVLLALQLVKCGPSSDQVRENVKPKVVVLVSLDQFRWDYFERFTPFFKEDGFLRFLNQGAVLRSVRYRHAATMTCPGHATISTGANGNVNGIVANDWYDVVRHRRIYCAEDSTVTLLGHPGGGRSPRLLEVDAIGDVLKRRSPESKVFSVAGKDRAAIMMGGHHADAAYWLQDSVITSSTYYMNQFPDWVNQFNARRLPQQMYGTVWDRVLPAGYYDKTQGPDDAWNEEDKQGLGKTFPHVITGGSDSLDWNFYEALRKSPFDDEIVLKFAEEMVENEGIGQDDITDLLAIGFSSIDRIGHPYGPDSHEIMDNVIRTDRLLSKLFAFLEDQIGMKNVLVVVTADHGIQRFPENVADPDHDVLAARVSTTTIREDIAKILDDAFGAPPADASWIEALYYPHVYLRRAALRDRDVTLEAATGEIAKHLPELPRYSAAIPSSGEAKEGTPEQFSMYDGRSGDILIRLSNHHINSSSEFGTTHGTPWEGDRHVPMLWLGGTVAKGVYDDSLHVVDLAPTLATMLGLVIPSTMAGHVIGKLLVREDK